MRRIKGEKSWTLEVSSRYRILIWLLWSVLSYLFHCDWKPFPWRENSDAHQPAPQTCVLGESVKQGQVERGVVQWKEHCTWGQVSRQRPSFANTAINCVTLSLSLHHLRPPLSGFLYVCSWGIWFCSFIFVYLSGFGIKVMQPLQTELGYVSSSSVFWKRLCRSDIISPLNVSRISQWKHFVLQFMLLIVFDYIFNYLS